MARSPVHAALDRLAMWAQDRLPRVPEPYHPPERPLACFGPLPPLPAAPAAPGPWWAPSPLPADGDRRMGVVVTPARGARRGTVLLVPPWKLPGLRWLRGWVTLLAETGLEVWTVVPPRHLARTRPGTRSGEGFVSPDVRVLQAAFEQLVVELRVLAALARARGGVAGAVGLSLGALGVALAATAPERLDFAALVAPPADLAAVLLETPIGARYLALARRAGQPVPERAALAPDLARFRPADRAATAGRLFLALGEEDRIALPAPARELARAWGVVPRAYPRGHLTLLLACRRVRRDLAGFAGTMATPSVGAAIRPSEPRSPASALLSLGSPESAFAAEPRTGTPK